jgi:hypothetical protein
MTGEAALRRPLCFITGSLTFTAVLTACISMTTATAQHSAPDYSAIIAAATGPMRTCRPTSGATPSSCWHSLALAPA